jgi:hypothetical protein
MKNEPIISFKESKNRLKADGIIRKGRSLSWTSSKSILKITRA